MTTYSMKCPPNELSEHYADIDTDHSEHYTQNWRTHTYPVDARCNLEVYQLVRSGIDTQTANAQVRERRRRGDFETPPT